MPFYNNVSGWDLNSSSFEAYTLTLVSFPHFLNLWESKWKPEFSQTLFSQSVAIVSSTFQRLVIPVLFSYFDQILKFPKLDASIRPEQQHLIQKERSITSSIVGILKYLHILIFYYIILHSVHIQWNALVSIWICHHVLFFVLLFLNSKTFFQTRSTRSPGNCKATHF